MSECICGPDYDTVPFITRYMSNPGQVRLIGIHRKRIDYNLYATAKK
jgi:hypothetical protein